MSGPLREGIFLTHTVDQTYVKINVNTNVNTRTNKQTNSRYAASNKAIDNGLIIRTLHVYDWNPSDTPHGDSSTSDRVNRVQKFCRCDIMRK